MANKKIFTNKESMKKAISDHREAVGNLYGGYIESLYRQKNNFDDSVDLSNDKDFFKFREKYISSIAPLDQNSVNNFVDFTNKSTELVKGKKYYQNKTLTTPIKNEKENLSKMVDFFDVVSGKSTDSGSGIHRIALNNAIDYQASYFKGTESVQQAKKIRNNLNSFLDPNGKINKIAFFDLETLGGTNIHNQKDLFGITEFTFNVIDKNKNMTQYSNLIGITKDQKNQLNQMLDKMENAQGIISNEDKVILDRLYKYGHSSSELKNAAKGQWKAILTDKNFSDEYDFDTVKKGIQKLYDIGVEQKLDNKDVIAKPYQDLINAVRTMTNKDAMVAGHNIQMADENWLNRSFMNAPEKVQEELKKILGPTMKLEVAPDKQIDTLRIANLYSTINNKNNLYSADVLAQLKDNGLSTLKQESLIRQYFPDIFGTGAAHAAEKDVEGSALLVLGDKTTSSPIQMMLNNINNHFNGRNSTVFNNSIVGNRQELFINDNTVFMDDFFRNGGLSFTKDKLSGEYITFDGKSIDESGNVFKGVKQSLKKNMTYTIGDKGKINLESNGEISKAIQELYPEYNQGSLYFAEFIPVFNSKIKGAKENSALHSPTYLVGTSQKELQDTINGMTLIGKANDKYDYAERVMHTDGYEYIKNKTIQDKIKSRYAQYNIQNGEIAKVNEASIESIINEGTNQAMREGAARQVRKDSYKTAVAFDSLLSEINKKTNIPKENIDFNSAQSTIDTALEVSQKVVRTKKHNLMALNEQSSNASQAILSAMRGEAINAGAIPIDAIFSYNYMGQQIPYSNTINNVIANFDYFASQNEVSQMIIEQINSLNKDGTLSSQQKEYMYQHLLGEVKNKLASGQLNNEEIKNQILKNSELAPLYAKDINYFEIDLGKDFFKNNKKGIHNVKAIEDSVDNTLKVNLDKKGGALINTLLNKGYGNLNNANKEEIASFQLGRLVSTLKSDKNYSDYFKDFEVNFGANENDIKAFSFVNQSKFNKAKIELKERLGRKPNAKELEELENEYRINAFKTPSLSLSEEILYRLKNIRKTNSNSGYINTIYRQNTLTDNAYTLALNTIKNNPDAKQEIKDFVSSSAANMPRLTTIDGFNARSFVQSNLIEDGLRDEFTNATTLIKKYGYSQERAGQLVKLYNRTESELTSVISNYVSEMSKANVDFVWNSKNKKAGLLHEGKGVVLNDIPKIKSYNGTMYIQAGRNEISLNNVLNYKDGSFSLDTSIGKAYKNMTGSFKSYAKNGVQKNDQLSSAVGAMKNFVGEIRNGSSVDRHDLIDRQSNFVLDYKDLIENLHDMNESGMFLDTPVVQKKVMSLLEKEGVSANRIFAGDKELFGDAIYDIFDVVKQYGNEDVKSFLSQNLNSLKDVQTSEFKSVFGGLPVTPWWQLVNQQRPPLNQIPRSVAMRESIWNKNYDTLKKANVLTNPLEQHIQRESYVHNKETLKFYRRQDELSKDYINIGFNAYQLDSSEIQLKALLNKDFNQKLNGNAKEQNQKLEKIHDVLMTTNLYEQEEVVDARIANTVFHDVEFQKVSAKKDLILELNNASLTQKQMEDLKGKILPRFELVNGELKVTLQREGKVVKRFDPIINTVGFGDNIQTFGTKDSLGTLKFGFFRKDGLLASDKEINSVIKNNGLNAKKIDLDTVSDIYNVLDDKFDAAFFVENGIDNGYLKLGHSMSEKSMAFAPMFGIGQFDENLEKITKKLSGIELQEGSEITFKDIKGKVLRGNLLNITANKLVEQGEFKTAAEARDAILREQYEPSRYLFDEILKGAKGINGESIFSITNHAVGKHENTNIAVENMTNLLIDDLKSEFGNDMNKIVDYEHDGASLRKALKLGNGIDIIDNKIVFKDNIVNGGDTNNYVDINMLAKLADKRGLTWSDNEGNKKYGLAFEEDGVQFGTIKKQYMNKVKDYDKISSKNYLSYDEEKKLLANKFGKGTEEYEAAIQQLRMKMNAQNAIERGTKITDREIIMMNFKKADSAFEYLQNNLSNDEFLKSAEHLIARNEKGELIKNSEGKYVLDKKATNESLLGYFTDKIKNNLFLDEKDIAEKRTLHDVIKRTPDGRKQYKHLLGIAEEFDNGKSISFKKAEEMYGISQGFKAMNFNAGNSSIEVLKKEGFKSPISIDKLSFALGQDASFNASNPNSFYNKSTIIDLGFGKQIGEENRYLAIPQMPMRQSGEDFAKYEFQSDVNKLFRAKQRVIDSLEGKKSGSANENYNRALKNYTELIDQTKEDLSKNITAKYGALHSAVSVKMDKSIAGKASAIALGTAQDIENISDEKLKSLIKNTNSSLREKNKATVSNALSKAQYKGESLANLYKEGKFVDTKFMGVEAFERLGFFNQKYMDKLGIKSKEEMSNLLSTKGTMGITGRYPTIYPESFKPTMMYLNDKLHGMRMQMTAEGQLSAAGDNDGDITTSFILQSGKDKYDYLAVQMHRDGSMNKQVEKNFKKDYNKIEERAFKNAETLIDFNAAGVNQFYHNEIMETLNKDITNALNNDLITVTGSKRLDNKVYAAFGLGAGSAKDFRKHQETYSKIENKILSNLKVNNRSELKSEEFLSEADKIISSIGNKEIADKYKKAIVFNESWLTDKKAMMAKFKKSSIGAANIPLFNLRKIGDLFIDPNDKNRTLKKDIIQNLSTTIEQDVISTKKATALQNVERTNNFVKSFNKLVFEGKTTGAREWLKDIADDDFSAISQKIGKDMSREEITNVFLETVSGFSNQNKTALKSLRQANKMAQGIFGVTQNNIQNALRGIPTNNDTMISTYLNRMKNAGLYTSSGLSEEQIKSIRANKNTRDKLKLIDGREALENESNNASKELRQIIQGTKKMFSSATKNISGKGLAIGALGIAGSFLVSGFVGGNPSKPADNHAADEADGEYNNISDFAATTQNQPMQKQQGYVININAQAPKGKQQAVQAIQNAAIQSTTTDINISMNINNQKGNMISDRDIEKLLSGAIN